MTWNRLDELLKPFLEVQAGIDLRMNASGQSFVYGIQCCGREATDELMSLLPRFTDLRALGLQDCSITNVAMEYLSKLHQLETLDLEGTSIDDRGLAQLSMLENLEYLHVRRTQVSEEAIQQLAELLPRCEIVADSGVWIPR